MKKCNGGIGSFLAVSMLIACVTFPAGVIVIEKSVIQMKIAAIGDILDAAATSVYGANDINALARGKVKLNSDKVNKLLIESIKKNLKLDDEFNSTKSSFATGTVVIEQLTIYQDNLPVKCEYGNQISEVGFHIVIVVPIETGLLNKTFSGTEFRVKNVRLHRDISFPLTN